MADKSSFPRLRFTTSAIEGPPHGDPAQSASSASTPHVVTFDNNVYYGSYRPKSMHRGATSTGVSTPAGSAPASPRPSLSQSRLQDLLENVDIYQDTYGLEELRDGFFDGFFFAPSQSEQEELQRIIEASVKAKSRTFKQVMLGQLHSTRAFIERVTRTRAGIKLGKSFLSFFIAYIICLIPAAGNWLGRYNYIMVLSAILNHAGRPVGAQIDGLVMTVLGGAIGLGWGSLALYASVSTEAAKAAYGGVLAAFLVPFTAFLSFVRCTFVRFYQAIICAGIAISYTCLANTSGTVSWRKVFDFGIPWIMGQIVSLLVCMTIFPDAGSRRMAVALHEAMDVLKQGLNLPRSDDRELRRRLAWNITNLSSAVRDLTIDISITRFNPDQVRSLRNLLQGVIRGVLVIRPETQLFQLRELSRQDIKHSEDTLHHIPSTAAVLIADSLAEPTRKMLESMLSSIESLDAVLMRISGYRRYLGPPSDISEDIPGAIHALTTAIEEFDAADEALLKNSTLPKAYSDHPEVVQLLLFIHPIRLVAGRMLPVLQKVSEMTKSKLAINPPSYPFIKSLSRTNAQVRHDRGGLTAGFYFQSKRQLERTMNDLQSRPYVPLARSAHQHHSEAIHDMEDFKEKDNRSRTSSSSQLKLEKAAIKYRLWQVLHYLQGFESRFTLKVVIVTTTLSIPAWLPQSKTWWNEQESWWAVAMVWLMMHPRIGGNLQDLFTRVLAAFIGAVWGGFAYAARDGDPYVMAVFAAILMVPMIYRFTQSSHPRSGMVGCFTFTIVSLSSYTENAYGQIFKFTWTRTCAFMVGIMAAIVVNWIVWPFVARHELRKSLSSMILHMSVLYRSVVARYIYYLETEPPTSKDIERSEMLEGRLREAFIRIRQLLSLSQHEIRLRAPFNPKPFELLIESCETFFEDLVQVRQSSLYFQPRIHKAVGAEGQRMNQLLLSYRRDAVASVLTNLYILGGAMKSSQPVPRYIPSAIFARKRLIDRMAELEAEQDQVDTLTLKRTITKGQRWSNVYQYAFNAALTDIVERLEDLQRIVKIIVGEVGFDLPDDPLED